MNGKEVRVLERRGVSLILFALGILVAIWTVWVEYQNHRMHWDQAVWEISSQAQTLADSLQQSLVTADAVLHAVDVLCSERTSEGNRDLKRLHDQVKGLNDTTPILRAVVIFDADGRLIIDTDRYPSEDISVVDRDYFQHFSNRRSFLNDQVFLGEPVEGRTSGQWFMSMARMIEIDGDFGGVVMGVVDVSVLSDVLRRTLKRETVHNTALAYSVSRKIVGVAVEDDPIRWIGQQVESFPSYDKTDAEMMVEGVFKGSRMLSAVRALDAYPLSILVSRDQNVITQEWLKTFHRDMTVLIVVLIAMGGMSLLAMRAISDRERLFYRSPNPICILNGYGRFIRVNPSWKEMLGLSEGRMVQSLLSDYIHPPERENIRRIVRRLSRFDHSENVLCRFQTRFSHDLWLELSLFSARGRVFCIARNQTERRIAEMALADSEERYRGIVETVVDGLISFNSNGRIQSVNPAAEQLFGYIGDGLIERDIFLVMPKGSFHDHPIERALAGGIVSREPREVIGRRADGSEFPIELGLSTVQLRHSKLLLCICRDISERKRIERLKDEFVSTVSHELRTPLTSIRGSLGLIIGGVVGIIPEKALRLVSIAHTNCERLVNLINDILDMQRIETGRIVFDIRPIDLVPLIMRSIEENSAYAAEHGVSIKGTFPEKAIVRGDPERLLQVMANLLSNAAKFSPKGGEISVVVAQTGGRIRISVSDQGPGIPPAFHSRIFQKFSQADSTDARSKGGTGLGLSITRSIVESLGGSIGYDSTSGKGTIFRIDLPLYDETRAGGAVTESCQGFALVVEEDPDVARLLQTILGSEGLTADIASDAKSALEMLAEKRYSLMTQEILLPDMDGMMLVRRVRERYRFEELPIVVVSAVARERLVDDGERGGVCDWVRKPLDAGCFRQAVYRALFLGCGHQVKMLHIDRDTKICRAVRETLGPYGTVVTASSLQEARSILIGSPELFDLVILDPDLPDGWGGDLFPVLKDRAHAPSVIVLSAADPGIDDPLVVAWLNKSSVRDEQLSVVVGRALRSSLAAKKTEKI